MWSSRAVQEHRVSVDNRHGEGSYCGLPINKWDMARVDGCCNRGLKRLAGGVLVGLGHRVVAVTELELNDVTHSCCHYVGHKRILWAADDNGNDLVRLGYFNLAFANRCYYCNTYL
jgi:hypothetical protein